MNDKQRKLQEEVELEQSLGTATDIQKALFCVMANVESVYFKQNITFWKFAWVLGKGDLGKAP